MPAAGFGLVDKSLCLVCFQPAIDGSRILQPSLGACVDSVVRGLDSIPAGEGDGRQATLGGGIGGPDGF